MGDSTLLIAQLNACFYCGKKFSAHRRPTKDHVWPRSSGESLAANKVFACDKCNQKKRSRLPSASEVHRARRLYSKLGLSFIEVGDPRKEGK